MRLISNVSSRVNDIVQGSRHVFKTVLQWRSTLGLP